MRPTRVPRQHNRRDAALALAATATFATMFLATTGVSADDPCSWDSSGNPICTVDIEADDDPWYFPTVSVPEDPTDWPPDDPTGGGDDPDTNIPTTTTTVLSTTTTTVAPQEMLRRALQRLLDDVRCVQALTRTNTTDWVAMASALSAINPGLTAAALQGAIDSHQLGITILGGIRYVDGVIDTFPYVDVEEASGRRAAVITVDPRFFQIGTTSIPQTSGPPVVLSGDEMRLFVTLGAMAYAMGHTSEQAMMHVLTQCLRPPAPA